MSAVATPHGVFVFTGASGAGKSTLASFLNQYCDWPLICDDVAVAETAGGRPLLSSGVNTVKLWDDALRALGRSNDGLRRDLTRWDKYHAIDSSRFLQGGALLRRLVHLTWGEAFHYAEAKGRDAFKIALEAVYRPEFASLFPNRTNSADVAALIAAQCKIGILTRPRDYADFSRVATLAQSDFPVEAL